MSELEIIAHALAAALRVLVASEYVQQHSCHLDHPSNRCPVGRARDVLADYELWREKAS